MRDKKRFSFLAESLIGDLKSHAIKALNAFQYLRSKTRLKKEITEQYPDPVSSKTIEDLPPATHGLLVNEILKCTACGDCVKICPTNAITLKFERVESARESQQNWISEFKIDYGNCLFCGYCAEACPPLSLTHTKEYEFVLDDLGGAVRDFGRGPIRRDLHKTKDKIELERVSKNKGALW